MDGVDFTISDHGSLLVLTPRSESATEWLEDKMPEDAQTWGKKGYVIEPRFVFDIVEDLRENGFIVNAD
jgi:hypothetical protein